MASDLDQLVMMGFDKERSEMALKDTGGRKLMVSTFPTEMPHPNILRSGRCHRLAR